MGLTLPSMGSYWFRSTRGSCCCRSWSHNRTARTRTSGCKGLAYHLRFEWLSSRFPSLRTLSCHEQILWGSLSASNSN
jgi:hypothetical protein